MKKEVLNLDVLDVNNLPELVDFEKNQKTIVTENPYIEIIDNKTYETAKQRRTALLKGRTALENQEKIIASKIASFRKSVGEKTKQLIDITLPHEEKQQSEVKRWEQIKENERIEKERIENERIDGIKKSISNFESKCYELIQSMTFESLTSVKSQLDEMFNSEMDVQEFDILLEQAKMRVQNQFDVKSGDLTEKENQRKENERLAREKEESDKKLREIEQQREKERLERKEKEREEKAKHGEIRKKRVLELGFEMGQQSFVHPEYKITLEYETVIDADVFDFEKILSTAKEMIENAKEQKESEDKKALYERRKKVLLDLGFIYDESKEYPLTLPSDSKFYVNEVILVTRKEDWFHEFVSDVKKSLENTKTLAQNKSEKENKERQKRLFKDKENVSHCIKMIGASFPLQQIQNKETIEFINMVELKVEELKNQLLNELNEL